MLAASVSVARRLGAGGEAEVFAVDGRPHLAYKRYRHPTPERTAKLRVMTAHPPAGLDDGGHVAIAWPVDVIEDGGAALGFTMPRIDSASTVPLFQVYNPQSRRQVAPAFSWRYLVRTARNVAAIVDAVHRAGYVIGDVNESNFLVSRRALVTLVDCDSLQVIDPATEQVHHCPVGKPEFMAPELQRADLATTPRTEASDRFALAVLLHLILLEGSHPFAGIWRGRGDPPDIGTRIARRAAAHHRRGPVDPSPFALDLAILPHRLRRLFQRALGAGLRRPGARPAAREWVEALDEADASLAECERSSHHVHAGHLRRCPWCARLKRGLPDPFPGPAGGAGLEPPPPTRGERIASTTRSTAQGVMGSVGGGVRRASSPAGAWLRRTLVPPLRSSMPVRLAAGAAGILAPLLALAVALSVRPLLGGWRTSGPAALGQRWALHPRRTLRQVHRRLAAAAADARTRWVPLAATAAAAGGAALLAHVGAGWSLGASVRASAAVAGALSAQPLPLTRRRPAAPAQRRAGRWRRRWPRLEPRGSAAVRWAVAGALLGAAGLATATGGALPSLIWPLDAVARALAVAAR